MSVAVALKPVYLPFETVPSSMSFVEIVFAGGAPTPGFVLMTPPFVPFEEPPFGSPFVESLHAARARSNPPAIDSGLR